MKVEVRYGLLTEDAAGALLQRPAARDLTPEEVISASVRKGTRGYSPLLAVRREAGSRVVLSVGGNPHYVASVMTRRELDDPNNGIKDQIITMADFAPSYSTGQ